MPEALVERAAALGYPAIALLDADGVYGAPRFHKAAKQAGLRAIIGAELTIAGGSTQQDLWRLPVLVSSAEGYQNLCQLITEAKLVERKAGAGSRANREEARFAPVRPEDRLDPMSDRPCSDPRSDRGRC